MSSSLKSLLLAGRPIYLPRTQARYSLMASAVAFSGFPFSTLERPRNEAGTSTAAATNAGHRPQVLDRVQVTMVR